ncbi:hypothetical protein D3C81_2322320 [compost metagenome]
MLWYFAASLDNVLEIVQANAQNLVGIWNDWKPLNLFYAQNRRVAQRSEFS